MWTAYAHFQVAFSIYVSRVLNLSDNASPDDSKVEPGGHNSLLQSMSCTVTSDYLHRNGTGAIMIV